MFNTQYMTNLTIVAWSKWNMGEMLAFQLWPRNDCEKWSRINIFEIPPFSRKEEFRSKVQIQ